MNQNMFDERLARNAEQERAIKEKAFSDFFAKYPQYECQANREVLEHFCFGLEVTREVLDEALTFPSLVNRLAVIKPNQQKQNAADEREEILQQIHALLQGTPEAKQATINRLLHVALPELRQRLEFWKEKARLSKLSPAELKAAVTSQPKFARPPLPAEWTRDSLISLAGSNGEKFRDLMRRYDDQSVLDRLNNRG